LKFDEILAKTVCADFLDTVYIYGMIIIIFVYWIKPDVRPHQDTCTQFENKC